VGSFLGSPLYVKLFESLKSALGVYKTSLEARSAERLVQFVSAVLQAFATVLEYSAGPDLGKQVEEYLTYIRQGPATPNTSNLSILPIVFFFSSGILDAKAREVYVCEMRFSG
jgi:hypothetical protein